MLIINKNSQEKTTAAFRLNKPRFAYMNGAYLSILWISQNSYSLDFDSSSFLLSLLGTCFFS